MEQIVTARARCYGAESFWNAMEASCKERNKGINPKSDEFVSLQEQKRDEFIKRFESNYDTIRKQFMTKDTKALDCHKQAAVFIASALEAEVLVQTSPEDKIALGPYMVLLNVSFSYLANHIDNRIKTIGKSISKLSLPYALACDTPYFEILCRILYYEDCNIKARKLEYCKGYNILDWADRFFLLEYITLLQNNIEPLLLKDKYWEQ